MLQEGSFNPCVRMDQPGGILHIDLSWNPICGHSIRLQQHQQEQPVWEPVHATWD